MKKQRFFITVFVLLVFVMNIYAQDWPQYLGPHRNSKSDEKGILRTWPETGPEVLWTVNVGIGYGGPVVKDGKVYLLDRDDKVGDNLRCFELSTGKELWNFAYNAAGSVMFPGSRSVPIVDDKHVYSCGPYGDLYCLDINTHKPVWNKNVWKDYGGEEIPKWAISQCPLIYGDLLILASQAPKAVVVAYEKLSGNVKWATPSLGAVGYVSPAIVKIDGKDQLVMITASSGGRGGTPVVNGKVVGIEPLTGKILWEFTNWICGIPVPGAVDAGDNKLLITGGYELGALMIKVVKKADGSYGTTELFRTEEFGDQTKTPLLHNGYFYAEYGTNNRRDGMVCMNMDGQIMWKTKKDPDFNKGSMILADGLILATDGATTLYLIEPDPSAFKPLAKAELLAEQKSDDPGASRFGTQNWAPIALADGKLLIRDQSRMMCVKVAQ
ncbi:MAG TPA: PQQ-binding-like beta-propeller repeat protein [Draconibacterium sp.]|nr:PQQ-binding-like beta-propeller repeat protein [Draconibacterium sp.]